MLIDSHCHIDQYPTPEQVVREVHAAKVRVVAVTNLPSHYLTARERLRSSSHVRPALGMHPLYASSGIRELALFRSLAPQAELIGEIGLDFSPDGREKKAMQERLFDEVLAVISDRPRFITLHSRGAVNAVLSALQRHRVQSAVFHWFTGTQRELRAVLDGGYAISINPAMVESVAGRRVIDYTPAEAILAETDGPFTKCGERSTVPSDVLMVYQTLAEKLKKPLQEVEWIIAENCRRCGLNLPGNDPLTKMDQPA